ncbi:MAG: phosphatase PAP2 family protein [Methylobacter sp.]
MLTQVRLDFDKFIFNHFVIPFLVLGIMFSGLEFAWLDLWITKHFYNAALNQWPYKEHWLAETVLHIGGRYFIYAIAAGVLYCLLNSFKVNSAFYAYRRQLVFLLAASISGPIIIALFKSNTHIYCPWNLILFGGDKPYVRLFDYASHSAEPGHCFPAAHAGAGFTFVSLYFFLLIVRQEYKFYGLYFGLGLGILYGVAQQMRGAHFLSHDVFSLAVCWFSSLLLFILFFRKQLIWA